jgi:hypothetical protein
MNSNNECGVLLKQLKTKHKHMKTILITLITATVAVGNTLPPTWELTPVDNTLPPTWELVPNSGDFDIRTING